MPVDLPAEEDKPGVPMAPPLFFVIPLVAALALEWFVPTRVVGGPWRWIVGALLLAPGIAINLSGFMTQRRAGTDPIPFHPSTKIVAHGPYRFTRNPMYVGFTLMTLGLGVLFDSGWVLLAAALGLILVDRLVVVREERYLERKFGEEYLAYKRRVRRWL